MVCGRNLYTTLDIIKEIEIDGVVSAVEYTQIKGCSKLNAGTNECPQTFIGVNSFANQTSVDSTRFQVNIGSNALILDANAGDLTSNITITPSGVPGTGIEVRALGNVGDPNQNKIPLNENIFLPSTADINLGELGSLRDTLNSFYPLYVAATTPHTRVIKFATLDLTRALCCFTRGLQCGPTLH
jgi:hypothetical protein